jgi:hypothetical protein
LCVSSAVVVSLSCSVDWPLTVALLTIPRPCAASLACPSCSPTLARDLLLPTSAAVSVTPRPTPSAVGATAGRSTGRRSAAPLSLPGPWPFGLCSACPSRGLVPDHGLSSHPPSLQDVRSVRLPRRQDAVVQLGREGSAPQDDRNRPHALPQGRLAPLQECVLFQIRDACFQAGRRRT